MPWEVVVVVGINSSVVLQIRRRVGGWMVVVVWLCGCVVVESIQINQSNQSKHLFYFYFFYKFITYMWGPVGRMVCQLQIQSGGGGGCGFKRRPTQLIGGFLRMST